MNKTISVIIPVYNAENQIRKCLDSIVSQTYRDLQIIIVDDGSDDDSFSICEEYRKKDERIELYSQKNAGVSAARNLGIRKAKGEYITFADADDYLKTDAYEIAMNKIGDCDAIFFGFIEKYEEAGHEKICSLPIEKMTDISDALYYCFIPLGYSTVIWNKIFRRSMVQDVYFDPDIYQSEDDLWFAQAATRISTVSLISDPLYYYVQRKESMSHSYTDPSKWFTALRAKEKVLSILGNHEQINPLLHAKIYNDMFPQVWNAYVSNGRDDAMKILSDISRYRRYYYDAEEYSRNKKMKYRLLEYLIRIHSPKKIISLIGNATTYKIRMFLQKGKRL